MSEMQKHLHAMGLGEGGNVGIEVWMTSAQFMKRRKKLFIEHEAITTSVRRDDRHSFVKRQTQPLRISKRLILSDQTELVPDVTQERELALSQRTVKGDIFPIGWIKVLGIRQDLDQDRACIGTAMYLIDGVLMVPSEY